MSGGSINCEGAHHQARRCGSVKGKFRLNTCIHTMKSYEKTPGGHTYYPGSPRVFRNYEPRVFKIQAHSGVV